MTVLGGAVGARGCRWVLVEHVLGRGLVVCDSPHRVFL
jgi:hypothetical protein